MNCSIWEKPGSIAEAFWKNGRADFPIYDMHGHMGSHYAIYFKRCDAPEMAAHLRRIGVRRLVFSHHHVLWGDLRNAAAVEIARQYPDLFRVYVAINPHRQDYIREDLAQFDKWAPFAVGLKFLASYHGVKITDKRYEYALSFANERGLLTLHHTWGGEICCGGEVMLEVAQKYPHAIFLMGHSIHGDWEYARRVVTETSGNTYLELTAIPGENGIIEQLVEAVGSDRILFGTDMPWFDEYQAVGGVLSAKISEDDMRNILYRNAQKLLGEEEQPL